ncbi:hypothetical protein ACLQ2R_36320 [Streptosporangium sp. DT93]|uniref:hypothetical protein n=1 Tax=Streptosporangium sp. DT93 TaxID=3393428 RepID=UPI003CFAE5DA
MDVKPLAAADQVSRPSSPPLPPPTASAEPSRVAVALRRTGIAVAGVGVAALTAAACVLSFEDLRVLAVAGRAPAGLAYLYPAAFDALLVIAMIAVLLLRGGWWPVRLQAGVILTLLFAGAAAAEVATAVRMAVDERWAAVVVALAPWVILVLALWLWLLLIKHAAARRAATDAALAARSSPVRDIVPFPGEGGSGENPRTAPAAGRPAAPDAGEGRHGHVPVAGPARAEQQTREGHSDHAGHPGQLVHHPAAEIMLDPHAAPPLESVPHHDLPPAEPVIGPTAAPETPEVTDIPRDPLPLPPPPPAKPMRWGDLVRPREGDLLVHPPRPAGGTPRETEPAGRVGERVETWETGTGPSARGTVPAAGSGNREGDAPGTPRAADHDAAGTDEREAPETGERGVPGTDGHETPDRDRRDVPETGGRGTGRRDVPEVGERDADTQPIRTVPDRTGGGPSARRSVADDPTPPAGPTDSADSAKPGSTVAGEAGARGRKGDGSPDPAHGAEAADSGEEAEARAYDGTAAPPSGRMRSTPVPPGE